MTDTENDEMAETAAKLDDALDSADETDRQSGTSDSSFVEDMQRGLRDGLRESLGAGDSDSTGNGLGEQFGRLLGEMVVRKLAAQFRRMNGTESDADDPAELLQHEVDGESLSEAFGDEVFSETRDDIEDGKQVVEETGELLETVDVRELLGAIDFSEVPEVIDTGEVPAAVANADPERAIELKKLATLVEFDDLWNAVDVREFMRNKDELEDAVDDATDSDATNGEDSESEINDSSLTDSVGSSGSADSSADEGGESFTEQGETLQVAIQSKLRDAVEEFREGVLDAREEVEAARDEAQATVEEKTGGGAGQPSSRNPTAYSTMVSGWKSGGWSSATFSTVPQETRHSSAPNHFRIYGSRFDEREDDDE